MCLLIFAWKTAEQNYPLIVAANRDERYDRPSVPFTVLQAEGPRLLGGRDEEAGGSWLVVNEYGVVAGLTNAHSANGPNPIKLSRGSLPILLAQSKTAREGADEFIRTVDADRYNPACLFVGDRDSLFYLDLSSAHSLTALELEPGVHILENIPLDVESSKVKFVEALIEERTVNGTSLWDVAPGILASHATVSPRPNEPPGPRGALRTSATLTPCVHTERYGTRSASIIRVNADPSGQPDIKIADGAPCTHPFVDVTSNWFDGAH